VGLEQFSLDDKVALVTGGNGGLGKAMAVALREAGARVAVTGRDPDKNAAVQAGLPGALVLPLDVRDEAAVERAVASVVDGFGRLDVLVNNAGQSRGGSVLEMTLDDWRAVVDTHLTGAFVCAKHAAKVMVAGGEGGEGGEGGKIINISSAYARYGPPDFANYAAAKAGQLGLTHALAVELAPHRIQVNAILPGWFETDLTRGMPATPLGQQLRAKTPAGRWGQSRELAGTVVFLASAASDFVTGAEVPVDGGYLVADRLLF
jgi:2-dehydro-3-deoxy-D-gluconate 5-dehydrogenase